MIDSFEDRPPLRTSINRPPNSAERAEAMARAEAKREKRAELAKRHEPAPRKFRDLSVADRIAVMRRRKKNDTGKEAQG